MDDGEATRIEIVQGERMPGEEECQVEDQPYG